MSGRWMAALQAAMLVLAVAAARPAPAAVTAMPPDAMCAAETARNERAYGIPHALLDSVSIVESGRYDQTRKATIAWPWTIMAEGQGRFLATKAEAVAEVRRLKAKGVKNIDVGCMQVNLMYHPNAFASLEDAFEPAHNVAYAARFLKGLYEATRHWPTAASYYHSQNPTLAATYREKLMKVWNGAAAAVAAAVAPKPATPPIKPVPGSRAVEEKRKAWRDQTVAARDEARRIADAYRAARLAEYQLRRARFDVKR